MFRHYALSPYALTCALLNYYYYYHYLYLLLIFTIVIHISITDTYMCTSDNPEAGRCAGHRQAAVDQRAQLRANPVQ